MNAVERINSVISERLGVPLSDIKPESNFIEDLGADSLDLVELIMSFEELADIEIDDKNVDKIKTVQDIYDFIRFAVGESRWNLFDGE